MDSHFPLLFYTAENYKNKFIEMYGQINSKYDHLFELVDFKAVNPKCNSSFIELIDDVFCDVEDLWIPFDFDERRNKFKRAFDILSEYVFGKELTLNELNDGKETKFLAIVTKDIDFKLYYYLRLKGHL